MSIHTALLLGAAGVVLLAGGLKLTLFGLRLLRGSVSMFGEGVGLLGSSPSDIGSIEPGWQEIVGTAKIGDAGTLTAPFSANDALLSLNRVTWTYEELGTETETWRQSVETVESVPFTLRDATGTITATFDDPAQYTLARETYSGDDPPGAAEWAARHDVEDQQPERVQSTRYEEATIEPGDEVYVFGEVEVGADDEPVITAGDPDATRSVVSTEGRKSPSADAFSGSIVGGILAVAATLLGLGLTFVGSLLALAGVADLVGA